MNRDHVPPQQFFAPEIRRTHDLSQLVTLRVHESCNSSYGADEDYFVHTLAPFARGSVAGDAILRKVMKDYSEGKNVTLGGRVLREFDRTPSGLILPGGRMVKRFEYQRLVQVGWKIARGLYYHHERRVLPPAWTVGITIVPPGEPPPEEFLMVNSLPEMRSRGTYPGVFDYRFAAFTEPPLLYFAMLLWDRLILSVTAHAPDCPCEQCGALRSGGQTDHPEGEPAR